MNNDKTIKLVNENGVPAEYTGVHDLWQLAMAIQEGRDFTQFDDEQRRLWSEQILQVWHMAHDLKSVVEGQGQARLVDPQPGPDVSEIEGNLSYVIEMAQHRADQWSEFFMTGTVELDEFYECDDAEMKSMVADTAIAVDRVSRWFRKVRS